jgi:hypothetical protein
MNARDHFDQIFGYLDLSPKDAAQQVFTAGWNAALTEAAERVEKMPFGDDTRASFAAYFKQMMEDA